MKPLRPRRAAGPLRVALVANWYAPFTGGAQIVIRNLARELARRHELTVLTPRRDPASTGEELDGDVRIRRAPILGARGRPHLGRKPLALGIFLELVRGRYDVAIAFPSLGPGASMTAAAARLRRFRTFLFVFDLIDYSRERLETFPDPGLVRRALEPPSVLRRRLRRRRFAAFDGLFALGATEADALQEIAPFCALLPVCVDLTEFPPPEPPAFAGGPVFGCVGRITPHKGQAVALRAFAQARSRLPGSRLVIAGAVYDEPFWRALLDERAKLGLEGLVDLRRDLARAELLKVYASCDVHLVPARFLSGGSIVQEAWAAGRPVIQSDRVDPSLVREGEDGFTFRFPSTDELAEHMAALASDRAAARRLGAAGRRRVERVFHFERLARALEAAWDAAARGPLTRAEARAVEALAWDGDVPSPKTFREGTEATFQTGVAADAH